MRFTFLVHLGDSFFPPLHFSTASIVLYLDSVTYFFSKYSHRASISPKQVFFKTILAKIQISMLNCAPFCVFCISSYFCVLLHEIASNFSFVPSVGLRTIVKYLKNTNVSDRMLPSRPEDARSLIRELGNRSLPIASDCCRVDSNFSNL